MIYLNLTLQTLQINSTTLSMRQFSVQAGAVPLKMASTRQDRYVQNEFTSYTTITAKILEQGIT